MSNGLKLFGRVSVDHAIIVIVVTVMVCTRVVSFGYLSSLTAGNPSAYPYPIVSGDSIYYARSAANLLTLHAYQQVPGVPLRGAPPGYPALLAGTLAATGSMTPLVVVQILFAAFALVLLYRMSRTLLTASYAAIVALVYATDPMVVFADSTLITDGLFSSLLICIVYLAFFYVRPAELSTSSPACAGRLAAQSQAREVLHWGFVGMLLGIATMIRPIAEFLVFVFPMLFLLREWMRGSVEDGSASAPRQPAPPNLGGRDGSRLKVVVACVAGFALIVVPWMARNHAYFGSFEISWLGGYDLLTNDVRGFLAWRALANTAHPLPAILVMRHVTDPVFAVVDQRIERDLENITPPGGNKDSYDGRLAIRYIMHDPLRYAYFHTVNTIPFFISSSVASYRQIARQLRSNEGFYAPEALVILDAWGHIRHPENARSFANAVLALLPTALEVCWWLLVALLALGGLIHRRRDFMILLCAVLVAYFAGLTGPMSASRYRIPAEPYLLILAAVGAQAVVRRTKEKLYKHAS